MLGLGDGLVGLPTAGEAVGADDGVDRQREEGLPGGGDAVGSGKDMFLGDEGTTTEMLVAADAERHLVRELADFSIFRAYELFSLACMRAY